MTRKIRYGLLLGGFLFFLVAAPALVLYVQGRLPSFNERRAINTGIISIESNPSKANVFLNSEKLDDQTPTALRFLNSGDYELRLEKEGYRTWSKRLSVFSGRVTHAGPEPEKLALLKDEPEITIANSDISFFEVKNDQIIALDNQTKSLKVYGSRTEIKNEIKLSAIPEKLIFDQKSEEFILFGQDYIQVGVLTGNETPKNISLKPVGLTKPRLNSAVFYWMEENNLKSLNLKTDSVTTIAENVLSYELTADSVYFIKEENENTFLEYAILDHAGQITNRQTLATNLPNFTNPELLIDNSKAVFTLDSGTLLRINQVPEQIARDVVLANTEGGTLTYFLSGELWWYESSANRSHIISRRSDSYHAAYLDTKLQYILFSTKENLNALEIHSEGGQNKYTLSTEEISSFKRLKGDIIYLTKKGELKLLPLFS